MSRLKKLAEDKLVHSKMDFNQYLCSLQILYQQVKFFHWITTGENFRDVHLFFDEVANGLLEIIDETAERMTFLGIKPLFGPKDVDSKSYISFQEMDNFIFANAITYAQLKTTAIVNKLIDDIATLEEIKDFGSVQMLSEHIYKLEDNIQRYRHFLGA